MTMNSAPIRARGIVFCGSFTSSPAVDTASRPMKEKKIVPAAVATPAAPKGAKSAKWSASNAVKAMIENITSTVSLITTMIGVDLGRLAGPADQQDHAQEHQHHRRQVDDPGGLTRHAEGGGEDRLRQLDAGDVDQRLVDVAAPADRHGGGRDPVLQQQAGGDAHRDDLAESGVRVGVGGAGDRHRRRHLRVADGRQTRLRRRPA